MSDKYNKKIVELIDSLINEERPLIIHFNRVLLLYHPQENV